MESSSPLIELQAENERLLQRIGLEPEGRKYTPHVTLLYGDRFVADRRVDAVSWAVHEFVLVHSLLGRCRYNVLARFPLRGQA